MHGSTAFNYSDERKRHPRGKLPHKRRETDME